MARKQPPRKARAGRRVVGVRVHGRVYRAVLTQDLKVGGYTVRVPGLPGCITEGNTIAEAKRMTKEAIELWLSVNNRKLPGAGRGLRQGTGEVEGGAAEEPGRSPEADSRGEH